MRYKLPLLLISIFIALLTYQLLPNKSAALHVLNGQTMGTTYSVSFHGEAAIVINELKTKIDHRLIEINDSMSTWIETSEISQINQMPQKTWIPLSAEFSIVLSQAIQISNKTAGAFDITIGPLVNLMGFGPAEQMSLPGNNQILKTLESIGYHHLEIKDRSLKKNIPNMYLDFSGIAKGYGVDEIAKILDEHGIDHYTAEIGGEARVKGLSHRNLPWSIGIETPTEMAPRGQSFIEVVALSEGALATSGSYRIFRNDDGKKSHHILDPKKGIITHSDLVSVTAYAPTCMEADGVATALMVMGKQKGMEWVEGQSEIEALFVTTNNLGEMKKHMSSGFKELIR